MENQIIRHFLVTIAPFGMGLLDDIVDLGKQEGILFMHGFGFGAAHVPKELFGMRQVVRLLLIVRSKEDGIGAHCSMADVFV